MFQLWTATWADHQLHEPTTGLHPGDTAGLMVILQRLVDAGNSVIVVEHNPDLVKAADWGMGLGPKAVGLGINSSPKVHTKM